MSSPSNSTNIQSLSSSLILFTVGYILGSIFSDIAFKTSLIVLLDTSCQMISPSSFIPKYIFPP